MEENSRPSIGNADAAFDWAETYACVFASSGRPDKRIVDAEGFANWGNPDWAVDYDDAGFIGGALIRKKFEVGNIPLRIKHAAGPVTAFATSGLATARIGNSVTDIDFGPNMPSRVDPDDAFRDSSAEFGWVIGLGVATPLADARALRLEGSYLDFGRSTHYVNRSGDGRCGLGNPRRPCPYNIENKLGIVRLAIIHRFSL